ncbi:hypothetical protein, partial [Pseudomonas sp. p99-361]|uniref:hypothetical protein n=1 Tax=Pseudomonas sp. p99-361 TaxID=2479852 RepID=UPI001C49810E
SRNLFQKIHYDEDLPVVGAALCRERAAKRPQQHLLYAQILGALRTPFATQGRSYNGQVFVIMYFLK